MPPGVTQQNKKPLPGFVKACSVPACMAQRWTVLSFGMSEGMNVGVRTLDPTNVQILTALYLS